jgi:hypothetical protein
MHFHDILSIVLKTDTPNSLQSGLLTSVTKHIMHKLPHDYDYLASASRLIPKKPLQISFKKFFKGSIGELIDTVLLPTTAFITVENFRELFKLLENDGVAIMHATMLASMEKIFADFLSSDLKMKDEPLGAISLAVFARFDGAYNAFLTTRKVHALFDSMASLGTILIVSEMKDCDYLLKRSCVEQSAAFLTSRQPDMGEGNRAEIFELFDVVPAEHDPSERADASLPLRCGALHAYASSSPKEISSKRRATWSMSNLARGSPRCGPSSIFSLR